MTTSHELNDELRVDYLELEAVSSQPGTQAPAAQLVALGLARPHKANALSANMVTQTIQLLNQWQDDATIRAVLIYGVGKHFCAGADLRWMQQSGSMAQDDERHIAQALTQFFKTLAQFDKPIVSYVHNQCVGGALGIVSLSDSVICQYETHFSFGESVVGLSPWVIYPYVSAVIPQPRLKQMMLSAQRIPAYEAHHLNLCHQLVDGCPRTRLTSTFNRYLMMAPSASRHTKRLFQTTLPLHEYTQGLAHQLSSAECQTGLKHYFAKTAPAWQYRLPQHADFDELELSHS